MCVCALPGGSGKAKGLAARVACRLPTRESRPFSSQRAPPINRPLQHSRSQPAIQVHTHSTSGPPLPLPRIRREPLLPAAIGDARDTPETAPKSMAAAGGGPMGKLQGACVEHRAVTLDCGARARAHPCDPWPPSGPLRRVPPPPRPHAPPCAVLTPRRPPKQQPHQTTNRPLRVVHEVPARARGR